VFKNIVKTIFEAIMFIFFMHPYDVGDRCQIDEIKIMFISLRVYEFSFLAMQTLFNFILLPPFLLIDFRWL
jgi:small-conductance mechanosensitive channel